MPDVMDPKIIVPGLAVDHEAPAIRHVVEDLDMPCLETWKGDTAVGGGGGDRWR